MPLTRLKTSTLQDGGITTAKLADNAVTIGKTNDLFVNTEISGTEAARMPVGTTAQRASAQGGDIRFNSTLNLMEYYTGSAWKVVDSPPTVSSVSPTNFDAVNDTITVTGTSFAAGSSVTCVGTNNALFPCTTTFVSGTSLTFVPSGALVANAGANDKYSIRVTTASGLVSADLSQALDFAPTPAFTSAAGSLGIIHDIDRGVSEFTVAATSADTNDTLAFTVTAGSLPSNMSMSTSGVISGTPTQLSAGGSTTSTFTVTCTATGESTTKTNTRQFTITVKGLIEEVFKYSSNAMQNWTAPADLTQATVEMWAGGGGAYNNSGGGTGTGGAGGYALSTINILATERGQAWKLVVPKGGGLWAGGYGGGGTGANGAGGGGGATFLLSPLINLSADPFTATNYGGSPTSEPTSEFVGKTMGTDVVMIAGGGGGSFWYVNSNRHAGMGGGLTGGAGGSGVNAGSQTAGGAGSGFSGAVSGSKFKGGYMNGTAGSGGSGGAGGGFYGGGVKQNANDNNSGGGGSSFIGFANGSTSTVLSANASNGTYTDSTTRTNGTRTYKNSATRRSAETGRTPYGTSSTYYDATPRSADGNIDIAYGAVQHGSDHGGNGMISIRY